MSSSLPESAPARAPALTPEGGASPTPTNAVGARLAPPDLTHPLPLGEGWGEGEDIAPSRQTVPLGAGRAEGFRLAPYILALPHFLVLLVFLVLPISAIVVVSFWEFNGFTLVAGFTLAHY